MNAEAQIEFDRMTENHRAEVRRLFFREDLETILRDTKIECARIESIFVPSMRYRSLGKSALVAWDIARRALAARGIGEPSMEQVRREVLTLWRQSVSAVEAMIACLETARA